MTLSRNQAIDIVMHKLFLSERINHGSAGENAYSRQLVDIKETMLAILSCLPSPWKLLS